MESQGKVRGFISYTPQIMEQMKKDLDVSMSLSQLLYCASYYRTCQKRDPFIEELKMLDRFIATAPISPASLAPTEILTNEAFAAETYADLMQKRRTLNPNAKYPCTLAEAFEAANLYLERVGKSRVLPSTSPLLESQSFQALSGAENTCVTASNASFRLKILNKKPSALEERDLFLLLLPASEERGLEHGTAVGTLFKNPSAASVMKQVITVKEGGLLRTLLDHSEGLWIDPSRLSRAGEPVPLSLLCGTYVGEYTVRVAQKDYESFYKTATACGIRVFAFASVTNGNEYTFVRGNTVRFSLASDFLRSLFPIRPFQATLKNEERTATAPISRQPLSVNTCSYLYCENGTSVSEAVLSKNTLCAVAVCRPEASFFRNALDTALSAVMTLAVSGYDHTEQHMALGLELPQQISDPVLAGENLSAILGIYRLQTELAIPATVTSIAYKENIQHPELTVFTMANAAQPCPARFSKEGNKIFCITPDLQTNGLPDFASLRTLLEFVASLRKRNILQSAKILCRESVTDGILSMSTDSHACFITGEAVVSDGALPLAILLETTESIPAKQVGTVMHRNNPVSAPVFPAVPKRKSLIWSEKPRVTIISKMQDTAAQMLAARLVEKGAEVARFCDDPERSDPLSRSILSSQTLIVCEKVTLPQTPRIRFALNTFTRAGGNILLAGSAKWDENTSAIAFPQGFSEKILDQICQTKI